MKGLFLILCFFALASAAEWQVIANNVLTIAFGVSATSHETVYVSGGTSSSAAILKSTDAGESWVEMPRDPQMAYVSIDAALGTDLVVAGSLGFYGQVAVGSYTDDGFNFEPLPYNPLFSASQSATAAAPNQLYLVGVWFTIRESGDGVISSQDGGATLNFHQWTAGTSARYGNFPSNNTWFISGGMWSDYAGSHRSMDPEAPFELSHRLTIHRAGGKNYFEFIDTEKLDRNGYIGVIQRSRDGGRTFETVFNETDRFYFNGINCVNELNCWVTAEGPEGAWIFRTSDGGNTWAEQTFRPGDSLLDVQMLNLNEGWAVGGMILSNTFNALFLHTVDGGKTWTVGETIPNCFPNALSLVTSDSAYATAFMRNGLSSILAYR